MSKVKAGTEEVVGAATSSSGREWAAWQLLDSLLPTGGFAHSQGLEAAAYAGLVEASAESVQDFCRLALHNQATTSLPYVKASFVTAASSLGHRTSDVTVAVAALRATDAKLHCQLGGNHVAQRASEALGASLLRACTAAFAEDGEAIGRLLKAMRAVYRGGESGPAEAQRTCCHQAVVFGALTGALGFDAATSQRMFLYMTLRDTLSAATRLNLVGPMEAAKMLRVLGGVAEGVVQRLEERADDNNSHSSDGPSRCGEDELDDILESSASAAPLLDLLQGCHDAMYSRLFSS